MSTIPQKKQDKPIVHRLVPFNFVDLEDKAEGYLAKVKAEALQIAAQARNEVARLRETTFAEIEQARNQARQEAESMRSQLEALKVKLQKEEENFQKRKTELESEAIKIKADFKKNEDAARKTGYDEGKSVGYDEGKSQGYADGELQATVDYAEKVRNEATIQLGAQLETLMPALQSLVTQFETAKQSFLQLWEQSAIQVATAIASRAISRQLPDMIDVPLKMLREALELAAGGTSVRIRLNSDDYEALKPQMDLLIGEMLGAAQTDIIPDGKISPGGCVLETSLGVIDNQIESRLERIEQELVLVPV